ncbi:MAG: chromosome segregation protein SMC [Moraxellaceae bacterium]
MRLQSLKLAGFKSFVDPVTFRFPDPLTAIVGPNGCGKSNVIDAIRWVMGESSARQLRGDAMSDVIFAGTSQRKPVGQASVELVFENTLGKLGGAYNHYTELAVRRQVTRDGGSDYFLNGQRCRRRDITDIFLGTGLGARSYAVIQQGMINRLVEAKPDDLRVFIEEAAGVSRYQSRRRETEQHLEHTRLNLSRLQDVAEELASQMRSLKRQSQAAERYRALQTEQQQLQVEIGSLRAQQISQQQQVYTEQLSVWGEQFRQLKTAQQQTEQQEQHCTDALTTLLSQAEPEQQRWQVAEQQLAQTNTHYVQLEQQLQQLSHQQQALTQQQEVLAEQLQLDQTNLDQLEQQRQQTCRSLQQLADPEQLREALNIAEQAWRRWQADEQQQQQQLSRLQQQRQQMQQQQAALEKQQQRASQQIQQLEQHQQQLAASTDAAQLSEIEQQLDEIGTLHQQSSQQQQQLEQQHQQLVQTLQGTQQQKQIIQQQLAAAQAEYTALQHMQAALSEQTKAPQTELPQTEQAESASSARLLHQLQLTAAGQQHAAVLEAMLARWLMAQPESSGHMASQALQAGQAYYRVGFVSGFAALDAPNVQPIQHWLTAPQLSLWAGVGIVADHTTALRLRERLQAGQSLLTETGEWVGIDWQVCLRQATEQSVQGALTCQLRLTSLRQQITEQQQQLAEQQQQLAEQHSQLAKLKQQQQQQTVQQQQQQNTQRQLELKRAGLQSRLSSHAQQQNQLSQQLEHLLQAQADDQAELNELYLELAASQLKIEPVQRAVASLQQQREALAAQRQYCLTTQQHTEQQRQRLSVEQHTQQTRAELLREQILRQQQQMDQLDAALKIASTTLQSVQQQVPDAMLQRDQAMQVAQAARSTWQQRQTRLQSIQAEQQQLIQQRHQQQQAEQVLRDQMEQARLAWQGCKAELAHVDEQFRQLQREPLSEVSGDIAPREQQLITITAQLARLGELNLAAPAALAEVSARHAELTHQMDDLQQTVQQLEQAMQQIDRETRSVFMQTFDQVNAELQLLFPKVFGGGEACLSLEDGWQSGVRLMARPPGKKNSNISLLSGGEKALTALALVFAIFRLNPAPFCLLDEVDAPLDDANVARFCHLVQELSAQVQFIFISHNKLAMSMASQLLGVTMPEAGVSRLVAVNLEQAAAFEPLQE